MIQTNLSEFRPPSALGSYGFDMVCVLRRVHGLLVGPSSIASVSGVQREETAYLFLSSRVAKQYVPIAYAEGDKEAGGSLLVWDNQIFHHGYDLLGLFAAR